MEHITVAGHHGTVPVSPVAARRLAERLEAVSESRGVDAAEHLERLVGTRIGSLLGDGVPSIDLATMRAIIDYVETPVEDEDEPSGLGGAFRGVRDRLAQRGGPTTYQAERTSE